MRKEIIDKYNKIINEINEDCPYFISDAKLINEYKERDTYTLTHYYNYLIKKKNIKNIPKSYDSENRNKMS